MGSAKSIILRPISAKEAGDVVRRIHYSGKTGRNTQINIGVFYLGRLEGAMQFGPPIDKRRMAPLVRGSGWHQFTELNRLAFSERLPRNSESRALGVAFRLLAKHAPQVKWVVSFADGCQCGDGTIYRASGFVLTSIKLNASQLRMPDGSVVAKKALDHPHRIAPDGRHGSAYAVEHGAVPLRGYQFRYVRFIDPTWLERLTVPIIPFSDIPAEARMYRGKRAGPLGGPGDHPEKGSSSLTPALHLDPGALE